MPFSPPLLASRFLFTKGERFPGFPVAPRSNLLICFSSALPIASGSSCPPSDPSPVPVNPSVTITSPPAQWCPSFHRHPASHPQPLPTPSSIHPALRLLSLKLEFPHLLSQQTGLHPWVLPSHSQDSPQTPGSTCTRPPPNTPPGSPPHQRWNEVTSSPRVPPFLLTHGPHEEPHHQLQEASPSQPLHLLPLPTPTSPHFIPEVSSETWEKRGMWTRPWTNLD